MNETPATVRMIDGATAPVISNVFVNNACAVCTLQITGTFTAATVLVEGIVNVASNQWVTLAAFNLSDLSLEKDGADKAGIYQVGIEGILRVRMNVTEISGGDITIAAQFGNATINQFSKTEASNLIPITAYDLVVAGGYTGTLEQFEADMGNSASNATAAANSADEAAQTLTDVQTAGTEAVDAVQAKGQEVLASIPEDYTELTGEVDDLKTQLEPIESYSVSRNLIGVNPNIFYEVNPPIKSGEKFAFGTFDGSQVNRWIDYKWYDKDKNQLGSARLYANNIKKINTVSGGDAYFIKYEEMASVPLVAERGEEITGFNTYFKPYDHYAHNYIIADDYYKEKIGYPNSFTGNTSVHTNGKFGDTSSNYKSTELIPLNAGDVIHYNLCATTGISILAAFNKDGSFIESLADGAGNTTMVSGQVTLQYDCLVYACHRFYQVPSENPYFYVNDSIFHTVETIKNRPAIPSLDFVNVKSLGAVGDGVTDDTQAIQDALESVKLTGGTVFVPAGVYLLDTMLFNSDDSHTSSALHIYSNTTLLMDNNAVLLKGLSVNHIIYTHNNDDATGYDGVENIKIIGGTIDENANGTISDTAINTSHATNIEIEGITFINSHGSWHYIEVNSSQDVYIHNCRFLTGANAEDIQLDAAVGQAGQIGTADGTGCTNILIENCYFNSGAHPAIGNHNSSNNSSNIRISNCVFYNKNGSGAINFDAGTHKVDIYDCTFYQNNFCAYLHYTTAIDSVFYNNRVENTTAENVVKNCIAHDNMINGTYTRGE